MIVIPMRFVFPYTPADFGLNYIPMKIITKDKIELDAWFIPVVGGRGLINQTPTIIVCHGFAVDKGDCIDVGRFLHSAGYNVVLFDFRGHGKSQGKHCSLGYYETEDIDAVIRWLYEQGMDKIGVIGFSMGGTTALLAAAKNPKIRAVVSDGAYLSFWSGVTSFARANFKAPKYPFVPPAVFFAGLRLGFNPKELNLTHFLHHIPPRPVLIIHGSEDREVRLADAYQIYSLLTTHNPHPKHYAELWVVQGAHHLESYYIAKEEYEHRVIDFFNSAFQTEASTGGVSTSGRGTTHNFSPLDRTKI